MLKSLHFYTFPYELRNTGILELVITFKNLDTIGMLQIKRKSEYRNIVNSSSGSLNKPSILNNQCYCGAWTWVIFCHLVLQDKEEDYDSYSRIQGQVQ